MSAKKTPAGRQTQRAKITGKSIRGHWGKIRAMIALRGGFAGMPPMPKAMIDLLLFSGPATLAGHAQGVLGWALFMLGPLIKVTARKHGREPTRR